MALLPRTDSGTTDMLGKARGRTDETKRCNNQPVRARNIARTTIYASEGGVRVMRRIGDVGKKEEHEKDNDGKERSAAQSSVSFSLEKETEEATPLPLLIS